MIKPEESPNNQPRQFWKLQENILEKEDKEDLVNFINTTERFTQFTKVREFEEAWSRWQGCRYSVYVNSGSSANLLMMSLLKDMKGWRDGDEVLVPAVTWVTNISPIFQCGLTPVFVDINLKDLSFDYDAIETKITSKTKAIFVTHLLGFPADITRIKEIVGNRDIEILEDCCESHGAQIDGKKVGNFGICSSFSFYWGHHITTVEGGMVCTDNEEVFRRALLKRSHGLARELRVEYHEEFRDKYHEIDFNFLFLTDGFNFRNTELHAVLGLGQLRHLDRYIEIRNKNYERFLEIIKPYQDQLVVLNPAGMSSFSLPFIFKSPELRRLLQKRLQAADIETRPIIGGNLLRQPFLEKYRDPRDSFRNAEIAHLNGFYIGNNQFVNKERLDKLKELVDGFFKEIAENAQSL